MKHILDFDTFINEGFGDFVKKGIEKGKKTILKDIVSNLKLSGASVDFIMDVTGMTKEEVEGSLRQ